MVAILQNRSGIKAGRAAAPLSKPFSKVPSQIGEGKGKHPPAQRAGKFFFLPTVIVALDSSEP